MTENRKTKSKEKIRKAFIELINKKGFEEITVSDIARKAEINRGTFYQHYKDKYDLLEKLEQTDIENLEKILLSDKYNDDNELISNRAVLDALKYVYNDIDYFKALTSKNGDHKLMKKVKAILNESINKKLSQSTTLRFNPNSIPREFAREIILSTITSIINLWLSDPENHSPEEIAEIINISKNLSPMDYVTK